MSWWSSDGDAEGEPEDDELEYVATARTHAMLQHFPMPNAIRSDACLTYPRFS